MKVDERLNMGQQGAPAAQTAKGILGCIKRSVTSKSTEAIPPLHSALMKPHPEHCIHLQGPQYKDTELLEMVQRRATN